MKKRNMIKKHLKGYVSATLLVILILTASGCASLSRASEDEVLQVLDLMRAGSADELSAMSGSPFLLDGEILQSKALVKAFWEGMAGFSLENAVIIQNRPALPEDATVFGDNAGVKAFFSRHLPDNPIIVEIESGAGRVFLLTAPLKGGEKALLGWGGPY